MTRKSAPSKLGEYCVGITILFDKGGKLARYENGLRQNVVFLYRLFAASQRCKAVYLLNHGDGEPLDPLGEAGISASAIVRTELVLDKLDLVISPGAALDIETVGALKERNVPIISYKGAYGGVIAMEAMCSNPPQQDAERYFDPRYYDVIWMALKNVHTYKA